MDTVQYRDLHGYPGYRVGNDGTVWSAWRIVRGRWELSISGDNWHEIKPWIGPGARHGGYKMVRLRDTNRTPRHRAVHQVVLEAFIGPRPIGHVAAHNNGVRLDNRLSNLRWATPLENRLDRYRHGTAPTKGGQHVSAKLTDTDIQAIFDARDAARPWQRGAGGSAALAARYGVTQAYIRQIVTGRARVASGAASINAWCAAWCEE